MEWKARVSAFRVPGHPGCVLAVVDDAYEVESIAYRYLREL